MRSVVSQSPAVIGLGLGIPGVMGAVADDALVPVQGQIIEVTAKRHTLLVRGASSTSPAHETRIHISYADAFDGVDLTNDVYAFDEHTEGSLSARGVVQSAWRPNRHTRSRRIEAAFPGETVYIVTGTKRSGTSLWMQMLIAAGYTHAGTKFPRNWEEKLRAANPRGFYESEFRSGIYWETNPHPTSGRYLRPEHARKLLVKVFIPGLVRSDVAFLDRTVASIRSWRDVVRSTRTMRAIEAEVFHWADSATAPMFLPPEIEWLRDNFLLVRDLRVRNYPHCVVAHSELMRDPAASIHRVLSFLDGPLDQVHTLAAQVDPSLHRNHKAEHVCTMLDDELIALLDTWGACVDAGKWDDLDGLTSLNTAWKLALERGHLSLRLPWDDPRVRGE